MMLDTAKFSNMIDHSVATSMYNNHANLVLRLVNSVKCSKYDYWDMYKEYSISTLLNTIYEDIEKGVLNV